MTKLKYKFTYDTLCKMLFVRSPVMLKRLIAAILGISPNSISEFTITNPEITPELIESKFCRLDINMVVNGRRANLEVQVSNEGDYPERTLYNWARLYSSALKAGNKYISLPQVIIISIVDFKMFKCAEFHSKFQVLETTRHELLSNRLEMHYFEVRKLPENIDINNDIELILSLFRAKTEEDLNRLEALEVPLVKQAIGAYREITVSPEFLELERIRADALHNEASALANAERKATRRATRKATKEATMKADAKWQVVVADKDAELADKDAELADKDAELAGKDARIAELEALVRKNS